ncbi:MAG: DUF4395 family protein [Gemmatimonadetes bacterium]|jgi:rhodanese-related sulfurtransferase|nr:DUF4395 family protein [Gemmatimonadota bacterium]
MTTPMPMPALKQQGYNYDATQLRQLSWGLRFTPFVCMVGALYGLAMQWPAVHFTMAALGILPFWAPAWHPVDRLYNHLLRPLWGGTRLPPNPLPRRIACAAGGSMNLAIGIAFLNGATTLAYVFGAMLVVLQLIVITTHFCVASWLYEGALRMVGGWARPISADEAKSLVAAGARLIDVREPDEFARGHLPGASNIPVDAIEQHVDDLRGAQVVLYCQSGMRSQRAWQVLTQRCGLEEIHNLGAMSRWG